MKKIIFCLLFLGFGYVAQAQTVVELAAFLTPVDSDYFNGISNVRHEVDHNNIHRYRVYGGDPQQVLAEAKAKGFNARILDLDDMRARCVCGRPPAPTREEVENLRNVFFGFDSDALRPESRTQLDILIRILKDNPSYNVRLQGHTDAKGSQEYNDALAIRRINSVKDYLTRNGISASRINGEGFGKNNPIARNESNGQDSPEGRQLNRRVELTIFSADGKPLDMVEDINVPAYLRN